MPSSWYNIHTINKIDNKETQEFYKKIVAEKKPYFMKYIYPALKSDYETYIKNTDRKAMRQFGMTVDEIKAIPYRHRSKKQREFVKCYDKFMPVGLGACVINKICWRFEAEFDGTQGGRKSKDKFDYTIMKSGKDYPERVYKKIKSLYKEYNERVRNYAVFAKYERIDTDEAEIQTQAMREEFQMECAEVCPDEEMLCDVMLDICYTRNSTKQFVWDMCGDQIIRNLLKKKDNMISYPTLSDTGEFTYRGERFTIEKKRMDEQDELHYARA